VFVVELDLGHLEAAAPQGLVPETILERAARVFLIDEELYLFRVVKLGECVQTASPGTVFGYPWRSKRFKVSTPVLRCPCRSSASADAASATSVSGGNRSSMNRCSQRNAARS
jgi:hypothetical protein